MKIKGYTQREMARRTKLEAEQTRDAILDAAERVFYAHGVACTSLEELLSMQALREALFYWHFKDKIALCEAMLQRVFLPQERCAGAAGEAATPIRLWKISEGLSRFVKVNIHR